MAKYRVLERSFINDTIQEEGAIVTLPEGVEAGSNLQLIDDDIKQVATEKSK